MVQYFADINSGDLTTIFGILAAVFGGFFALQTRTLNQSKNDRDADRSERLSFTEAIQNMSESSERVAVATERSAAEAKQRNGHLAELVTQGNKATVEVLTRLEGTSVIAAGDKDILISKPEGKKKKS